MLKYWNISNTLCKYFTMHIQHSNISHGLAKKVAKTIAILLEHTWNKKVLGKQQKSMEAALLEIQLVMRYHIDLLIDRFSVSSNLLVLPHVTSNDENSRQCKMTKSIAFVSHAHLACRPVPGKWLITADEKKRQTRQTTALSSRPETSRMPTLRSRS